MFRDGSRKYSDVSLSLLHGLQSLVRTQSVGVIWANQAEQGDREHRLIFSGGF